MHWSGVCFVIGCVFSMCCFICMVCIILCVIDFVCFYQLLFCHCYFLRGHVMYRHKFWASVYNTVGGIVDWI